MKKKKNIESLDMRTPKNLQALKGTIMIKENMCCQNHAAADVTGQEGKDRGPRITAIWTALHLSRFPESCFILIMYCTPSHKLGHVT